MTLASDALHAVTSPRRAWRTARSWARLAHGAGVSVIDALRYRNELRATMWFRQHLAECRRRIGYAMPEAEELYVLVRAARPRLLVETGVASGISSSHILLALERNGDGRLVSLDLPNVQRGSVLPTGFEPGWMVPAALRPRWTLQVGDAREYLPGLLEALGTIDLFLHDSDHSYNHMRFEYELAWPHLRRGGLLLSDDTHEHTAWDDFCEAHGVRPHRVGNLGVARKC